MKKFFSPKIISEKDGDLFASLIDLIDSRYVCDRSMILKDIAFYESLRRERIAKIGTVFVHTARTLGVSRCCLSCSECEGGIIEILIIWNDIFSYNIGDIVRVADLLDKMSRLKKSNSEIIESLMKL